MNMSNMSAAFIGADRALYWRDVKRLIRGRWQRVRSRYELGSLSDEYLHDIGLTRGDIPHVVKGHAPVRPNGPERGKPANTDTRRAA